MDGIEAFANFFPAADNTGFHFANLPPTTPITLPVPTVPAETVEAQSALNDSGGAGSVVSVTSAIGTGITINLLLDAAAMASTAAAAAFRAGITQAASILSAAITDQITSSIRSSLLCRIPRQRRPR